LESVDGLRSKLLKLSLGMRPRITATGRELRLLSLADRAIGLQLLQLMLDRDGVDMRFQASFAMAKSGHSATAHRIKLAA